MNRPPRAVAANALTDRDLAKAEIADKVNEFAKTWINTLVEYAQRSGLFTATLGNDIDTSIFVGALVDCLDRKGYVCTVSASVCGRDDSAGVLILLISFLVRRKDGEEPGRIIL